LPYTVTIFTAVTTRKADNATLTITIQDGYPVDDWTQQQAFHRLATDGEKSTMSCNVFDPASWLWKPGTADLGLTITPTTHPRVFTATANLYGADTNIRVGDLLGCRPLEGAFGFSVVNTSASVFHRIVLQGGTSFGFFQSGAMQQNTWDGCEIRRPPRPAGATVDPLLAMGADGFHNAGNKVGPKIVNCHFERMTDDGIAIHGAYALVVAVGNNSASSVVLQTDGVYVPDVGDTYRLYDRAFVPTSADFVTHSVTKMNPKWRPKYNTSKTLPRDGFK
jgi:hypothetical protein